MTHSGIDVTELWEYLTVIADELNKCGIEWTTIGGMAVFGHLVGTYGEEEAKKLFKEEKRETDDIDIISKHYGIIDVVKDLFGTEVHRSLSLPDKYTIKDKEQGVHIDIYIPRKSEEYYGYKFNDNVIRPEIFNESRKIEPGIYVASVKDLIDLKLGIWTQRGKPREKDVTDLKFLLSVLEKEKKRKSEEILNEMYKNEPWKKTLLEQLNIYSR